MCVFRACNLCSDQANKHVQGFFIWVSYHDEHERALAARASTQICHGACGSCPCRSRPLRLCVPADPVPAPITWRLLLIITFKRILPMQLLHMRLRHPQQLLVHAPIASYYQYLDPRVRSTRTAAVHTPALQTSWGTRGRSHTTSCALMRPTRQV